MGGRFKIKKVTVALDQIDMVCRACGRVDKTVTERTYNSTEYKGPCGDNFCYGSCSLAACHPTRGRVCDGCFKKKAPLAWG